MANQSDAAKQQHDLIGIRNGPEPFARTTHPDAQWFPEAGLGLFLHWGISAASGKVDLSWGMMAGTTFDKHKNGANKLPPNEYYRLKDAFNPRHYDPDKWLKVAKEAGFRYAVLTAKHHDGYSLWPSAAGELGVRESLPGVDLVKPFVEACRNNGLKVGLYYSPPDWYLSRHTMSFRYGSGRPGFEGVEHFDMDFRPVRELAPMTPALQEELRLFNRTQITELLTWYGQVDLIWFDGANQVIPMTIEEIRALQPGIVINPRLHGVGDFATPECSMPTEKREGWWELCHIWNCESWGYHESEAYKPTAWMLDLLCRTRAWNGNLLMNCAPDAQGRMPQTYYDRLAELKAWMDVNKEAVFGVSGGDYPADCTVPYTKRPGVTYCFLLPGEAGAFTVKAGGQAAQGHAAPASVRLLGNPGPLTWAPAAGGGIAVQVPDALRTGLADVAAIRW